MRRTQIQLDERTYETLRRRAFEKGCSVSSYVREVLAYALGDRQGQAATYHRGLQVRRGRKLASGAACACFPASRRGAGGGPGQRAPPMIFLDTSGIYALADRGDPHHDLARERFQALLDAGEEVLTHNYVLGEAMALVQSRLGLEAAIRLAEDCRAFHVEWVDEATHEEAIRRLARSAKRRVSLVDQVSFLVMKRRGVRVALAFDSDFEEAGFQILRAGPRTAAPPRYPTPSKSDRIFLPIARPDRPLLRRRLKPGCSDEGTVVGWASRLASQHIRRPSGN